MTSNTDKATSLGGTFTFPGTDLTVKRMGYGAMQLAGPHVFGEPRDRAQCIAVLREAIESGINHIDTSDFYGPHVTNQIIKEALHPYPDDLVMVTKLGAKRGEDGSWNAASSKEELTAGAHDNLRNLGIETIDIANFRAWGLQGPVEGSIEEQITALAELKEKGLIRHIGLSNVSPTQLKEAEGITDIVCIQNLYNIALRNDDALVDDLATQGIAYVPFFPLGGFTPLQSTELNDQAAELNVTPMQLALAWLLHRAPNMLLIPGTSSPEHLRENLKAATVEIPAEILAKLDAIGTTKPQA